MSYDTDHVRRIYRSTQSWTKSFSQARFKRQASRSFSRDWNIWTSWSRSERYSDSGTIWDRCRLRTRLHWTNQIKRVICMEFQVYRWLSDNISAVHVHIREAYSGDIKSSVQFMPPLRGTSVCLLPSISLVFSFRQRPHREPLGSWFGI